MSSDISKILVLQDGQTPETNLANLNGSCEVVTANSTAQIWELLEKGNIDGLVISNNTILKARDLWKLFEHREVIRQMPDGFAIVNSDNEVVWANQRLLDWFGHESIEGQNFYEALGDPEVLGPNYSPLSTALKTGKLCKSTLKTTENNFFQLRAAAVTSENSGNENTENNTGKIVVVTMRDVTSEMLHLEKLESIHRAGAELADLTPDEVFQMDIPERIELLKANIIHYTQDLLNYDVVEIRLIDQKTSKLETLLSVGIDAEESKQPLFARASGNGVSGFVCATGKSYLCEDTSSDPLYVKGLVGARSSLTVPLVYHDQVIGSFNVESPKANAFAESDLQLLEIFARDIAVALNTLELLVAQRTNTAQESVVAIHSAVASPIDEILNDTVHVIENYIGHDAAVSKRLRSILKQARNIKKAIAEVGQDMAPEDQIPQSVLVDRRPLLKNARILVIDADDDVRESAHMLLEKYGCIVETAHEGAEAVLMIRNCDPDHAYGAIISDIRLPDINGHELLLKLQEIVPDPPLVLMTGFGYDPGHSIVKARKAGLKANAILYKPFRLEQLLDVVQSMVAPTSSQDEKVNT